MMHLTCTIGTLNEVIPLKGRLVSAPEAVVYSWRLNRAMTYLPNQSRFMVPVKSQVISLVCKADVFIEIRISRC